MTELKPDSNIGPQPVLLIDAGNTRIKWVYEIDGELIPETAGNANPDDFEDALLRLDRPEQVVICSVMAPDRTTQLANDCEQQWRVPVEVLESTGVAAGVTNAYENPGQLGTDRWVAIIGAVLTHGRPVIVMDLGTATTLDAVDDSGQHLGGVIFPGPALMERSLTDATRLSTRSGDQNFDGWDQFTAQSSEDGAEADLLATNSGHAVANGIQAAQAGALAQFCKSVHSRFESTPCIVITGGAGKGIMPLLESVADNANMVYDPWLVFRGMTRMNSQIFMDDRRCSDY
jgi:type III pantothenate kinase